MRFFLLFIMLFSTLGCITQKISYNRDKIIDKYSNNYKIIVDNKTVDFKTTYLDKNNIKDIVLNKSSHEIKINQIKNVELFELKNLNLDNLSQYKEIGSIIINGNLMNDSLKDKIKIDPNAIKSLTILNYDKLNSLLFCRTFDKSFLIITTK